MGMDGCGLPIIVHGSLSINQSSAVQDYLCGIGPNYPSVTPQQKAVDDMFEGALEDMMGLAAGVILSGGPASVYDPASPHVLPEVWQLIAKLNIPVLGICYGMQELAHHFGGVVQPGAKREFGKAAVRRAAGGGAETGGLLGGLPDEFVVWMSHGDKVTRVARLFVRCSAMP